MNVNDAILSGLSHLALAQGDLVNTAREMEITLDDERMARIRFKLDNVESEIGQALRSIQIIKGIVGR